MPRAYTVTTAALALGMPVKWVDNLLSHYKVIGIRQERQGIARRLSIEGLLVLALTVLLIDELGLSAGKAIAVAEGMIKNGGRVTAAKGLIIAIDLPLFEAGLIERLESAVEIAPVPRRGRPPTNKTGRLD
jgi:hypothetical protein